MKQVKTAPQKIQRKKSSPDTSAHPQNQHPLWTLDRLTSSGGDANWNRPPPLTRNKSMIQRLTVTPLGQGTNGSCGTSSRRRWDFELGTAATADGYIVQKIDGYINIKECNDPEGMTSPSTPSWSFWEAWKVDAGRTLFNQRTRIAYTDQSSARHVNNKRGTKLYPGEIKFFHDSTTGNLGDLGVQGTVAGWSPGGNPQSGQLPSTNSQPAWWTNAPVEGPANRHLDAFWDCCDPASHWNDTNYAP